MSKTDFIYLKIWCDSVTFCQRGLLLTLYRPFGVKNLKSDFVHFVVSVLGTVYKMSVNEDLSGDICTTRKNHEQPILHIYESQCEKDELSGYLGTGGGGGVMMRLGPS